MNRRELLAMAATGAFAAEHLNRAPISNANLTVKLPQAEPVRLPNGITVLAVEDNRLPIALVRFQMEGAGSIYSPRPGVAKLTAEMLREGAAGRSGKQIVDEAARLGTVLGTAKGSGLTSRVFDWIDLLTSLVLHPTFPADEFSGVRQRMLVLARLRVTRPVNVAQDTATSSPSVRIRPRERLRRPNRWPRSRPKCSRRERYTPGNLVVSCIGRVRPAAFASHIEKRLGSWKAPDVNATLPPNPQPATARRIVLIDRPGAAQTELAIGGLLFDRRDPDWFPMLVMNSVFGGGINSRLVRILRYEKGYVFSVQSIATASRFPGVWQVRAATRTDATADSLAIILAQLRRLCDEPIPSAELEAAKRGAVGNFALNLEQPAQVLTQSYLRHRYGFSPDYWERYPAKIMAVTSGEAQVVAQKYLAPDRALIVAVGDATRIRPALEKLGKVEALVTRA